MYFVYRLLLGFGFLVLLPRFVIDAFRHGKYVRGFRERIGSVAQLKDRSRPVIWLHCVSVGETQAARPLVKAIKERFPDHAIVVSTITSTGQELARKTFKDVVEKVFYFPFDWNRAVRKSLASINPAAVLLMETEIWPIFLRECERKQIPVAIVNGRLSDQSFRRYRMVKGFMKRVLSSVDQAIMQTKADADRLGALGMSEARTYVSGNLKFDASAIPGSLSLSHTFKKRFALDSAPVILAASTHANEERTVLEAFKQIADKTESRTRLVIAPRHPERFSEVASLLKASGLNWSRRSSPESPLDKTSAVILLDTIGELGACYPLAQIVFVGGSISKTGGHNIVEPAGVGACVVTGPYTSNFRLIVNMFVEAGAIIQLPIESEIATIERLAALLLELLSTPTRCQELGQRAKQLVNQNLGATQRTVDHLMPMIAASPNVQRGANRSQPPRSA